MQFASLAFFFVQGMQESAVWRVKTPLGMPVDPVEFAWRAGSSRDVSDLETMCEAQIAITMA